MDDVTALRELHDFLWDEMEFFSDEADPDHQWTTQALGQKHDDLVERFHDAYPSLLAAVEARAALTPERLAKALDAVPWEPVRDPLDMVTYQEAAAQLLAALTTDEAVP